MALTDADSMQLDISELHGTPGAYDIEPYRLVGQKKPQEVQSPALVAGHGSHFAM